MEALNVSAPVYATGNSMYIDNTKVNLKKNIKEGSSISWITKMRFVNFNNSSAVLNHEVSDKMDVDVQGENDTGSINGSLAIKNLMQDDDTSKFEQVQSALKLIVAKLEMKPCGRTISRSFNSHVFIQLRQATDHETNFLTIINLNTFWLKDFPKFCAIAKEQEQQMNLRAKTLFKGANELCDIPQYKSNTQVNTGTDLDSIWTFGKLSAHFTLQHDTSQLQQHKPCAVFKKTVNSIKNTGNMSTDSVKTVYNGNKATTPKYVKNKEFWYLSTQDAQINVMKLENLWRVKEDQDFKLSHLNKKSLASTNAYGAVILKKPEITHALSALKESNEFMTYSSQRVRSKNGTILRIKRKFVDISEVKPSANDHSHLTGKKSSNNIHNNAHDLCHSSLDSILQSHYDNSSNKQGVHANVASPIGTSYHVGADLCNNKVKNIAYSREFSMATCDIAKPFVNELQNDTKGVDQSYNDASCLSSKSIAVETKSIMTTSLKYTLDDQERTLCTITTDSVNCVDKATVLQLGPLKPLGDDQSITCNGGNSPLLDVDTNQGFCVKSSQILVSKNVEEKENSRIFGECCDKSICLPTSEIYQKKDLLSLNLSEPDLTLLQTNSPEVIRGISDSKLLPVYALDELDNSALPLSPSTSENFESSPVVSEIEEYSRSQDHPLLKSCNVILKPIEQVLTNFRRWSSASSPLYENTLNGEQGGELTENRVIDAIDHKTAKAFEEVTSIAKESLHFNIEHERHLKKCMFGDNNVEKVVENELGSGKEQSACSKISDDCGPKRKRIGPMKYLHNSSQSLCNVTKCFWKHRDTSALKMFNPHRDKNPPSVPGPFKCLFMSHLNIPKVKMWFLNTTASYPLPLLFSSNKSNLARKRSQPSKDCHATPALSVTLVPNLGNANNDGTKKHLKDLSRQANLAASDEQKNNFENLRQQLFRIRHPSYRGDLCKTKPNDNVPHHTASSLRLLYVDADVAQNLDSPTVGKEMVVSVHLPEAKYFGKRSCPSWESFEHQYSPLVKISKCFSENASNALLYCKDAKLKQSSFESISISQCEYQNQSPSNTHHSKDSSKFSSNKPMPRAAGSSPLPGKSLQLSLTRCGEEMSNKLPGSIPKKRVVKHSTSGTYIKQILDSGLYKF